MYTHYPVQELSKYCYPQSYVNHSDSYSSLNNKTSDIDIKVLKEFLNQKSFPEDPDLADSIFKEKIGFQKASLLQTLALIAERKKLMYRNMEEIEKGISHCRSGILQLSNPASPFDVTRRRNSLEGTIATLESQKRHERVSCWQDIARLKHGLLETAREYKKSSRKAKLFNLYKNG